MYSGWCGAEYGCSPTGGPSAAAPPASSMEAASKPVARSAVRIRFFIWITPLPLDGEVRGRDRGGVETLGRPGVQRVRADRRRRDRLREARRGRVQCRRDRIGEARVVERELDRA